MEKTNWISVGDKLPPINTDVLVYLYSDTFSYMGVDCISKYYHGRFYWVGEYKRETQKITHWKKLPKPPKTK